MKRLLNIIVILFTIPLSIMLWTAGKEEEAAAPERGKYLAERGKIIPPEEVYIDSYIGYINYQYPYPEEDVGITLYSGHRQISFWIRIFHFK